MKKLLNIMTAFLIVSGTATSVVSCGDPSTKNSSDKMKSEPKLEFPTNGKTYNYAIQLKFLLMSYLFHHEKMSLHDLQQINLKKVWFNDGQINLAPGIPSQIINRNSIQIYRPRDQVFAQQTATYTNSDATKKDFVLKSSDNLVFKNKLIVPNWYGINSPIDFVTGIYNTEYKINIHAQFSDEKIQQRNYYDLNTKAQQSPLKVNVAPNTTVKVSRWGTYQTHLVYARLLFKMGPTNVVKFIYNLGNTRHSGMFSIWDVYKEMNHNLDYLSYFSNSESFLQIANIGGLFVGLPIEMELANNASVQFHEQITPVKQ